MLLNELDIQMYSLREVQDDFETKLHRLAKMGYNGVELAGNALPAAQMKAVQEKYGIRVISSHVVLAELLKKLNEHIAYNLEIGNKRIYCAWSDMKTKEDALRIAGDLNRIGEKCDKYGIEFGYHNHAHEFSKDENGIYLLDLMYANTDPRFVKTELDVYWVKRGGADPVQVIGRYSGRMSVIHLKEYGPDGASIAIGDGELDWLSIITAAKAAGAKRFIVEIEAIGDEYGMAQRSYDFLCK
jgi:sugar phosphate isomerase/epimerase